MPDLERLQLPLRSSGLTLGAHIAALDLLAARLDALPSRSRWPARVPINSKASFEGDIVHTNEVKVHVGGDQWIEMTASEAADYVRRRKATMLEEHARLTEGQDMRPSPAEKPARGQRVLKTSDMIFDPLFPRPSSPEKGRQQAASRETWAPPNPEPALTPSGPTATKLVEDGKDIDLPQSLQSLVDLVGEHLHDKLKLPNGDGGGSTVNEEGEPIYEIREDDDGRPIGPMPESTGEGGEVVREADDNYFSPEAVERRAALRRRIFHEGSDSDDEDDEMDVDEEKKVEETDGERQDGERQDGMDVDDEADAVTPKTTRPTSSSLSFIQLGETKSTPTTPTQDSYPALTSSHSSPSVSAASQRSPVIPPKSILKAPKRKKSVTFDESVPIPPDSPPPKRHGVPLDEMIASTRPVDAHGLPKIVPILKAPHPGEKKRVPETFGGLRTGFLGGSGGLGSVPGVGGPILSLAPQVESGRIVDLSEAKPPPRKMTSPPIKEGKEAVKGVQENPAASKATPPKGPAKMVVEEKPAVAPAVVPAVVPAVPTDEKMDEDPVPEPKKKSLFAQRRAPTFPKQSDSAPMSTMKGSVVEAPSTSSSAMRLPGVPPVVGSSQTPMVIVDDDSDDSEYGDLGEFSDDEEDEYALDEALLAREVALEFHRRQAWSRPVDEDDFDPEAEAPEAVMGIPRVSTITGGEEDSLRIVNPTADDLSQFLRVGRGEDGELVFEQPVINSDSETDGEDDDDAARDRRERRARRKDVMRRLMSGEYEELPTPAPASLRAEEYRASLPPSVGSVSQFPDAAAPAPAPAPAATTASTMPKPAQAPAVPKQPPATRDVVERTAAPDAPAAPTPPKKVSRFKAARGQ